MEKSQKNYETDCLQNFVLLLMFLLTTNFFKNSHIDPIIFFIFFKSVLNKIRHSFNTKFLRQEKHRKSSYQQRDIFALS